MPVFTRYAIAVCGNMLRDRQKGIKNPAVTGDLPVALLYVIARLCFPENVSESNLHAYYLRVARTLFLLVATTYATFALLLQPFIFGGFVPWVFASQLVLVVLAIVASRYEARAFHFAVLAAMIAAEATK